ncbi:MAG: S-formylglutathione hydrolase [Pseudomonas sp.]|nr:S-formylglutathione hydrolase [Pseudomonas sp.]
MSLQQLSSQKVFGGQHVRYQHKSAVLNCSMQFAVYLPPQIELGQPLPVLYWLSGLTCTDENFMQKAGALKVAAELGLIIVAPDTSPRGEGVPDDAEGAWDFGLGAGFYINATQAPWSEHYSMYDYVVDELPTLIEKHLPVSDQRSISGHSMGGHGALIAALREPQRYQSVSAFAPVCQPTQCPWGEKAFSNFLGTQRETWMEWDASALMAKATQHLPMLVDQGEADSFLVEQLKPSALQEAADRAGYPITLRLQPGYDHSYYFIASFIDEHLRFHAQALFAPQGE